LYLRRNGQLNIMGSAVPNKATFSDRNETQAISLHSYSPQRLPEPALSGGGQPSCYFTFFSLLSRFFCPVIRIRKKAPKARNCFTILLRWNFGSSFSHAFFPIIGQKARSSVCTKLGPQPRPWCLSTMSETNEISCQFPLLSDSAHLALTEMALLWRSTRESARQPLLSHF
jgi:hypothetical protein